jgi:hypothetical protein
MLQMRGGVLQRTPSHSHQQKRRALHWDTVARSYLPLKTDWKAFALPCTIATAAQLCSIGWPFALFKPFDLEILLNYVL